MDDIDMTAVLTEAALTVRLDGELDQISAPHSVEALLDVAHVMPPPHLIVLDLRRLTLLTAAGIRVLLQFENIVATRGARVAVVLDPDSIWWRLAVLIDTEGQLSLFTTPGAALRG